MTRLALFAVLVLWAASSAAQLVEPNQIGVRMGHILSLINLPEPPRLRRNSYPVLCL